MAKIAMKTPLVEMDGDEMTRIIWKQIKDIVIDPYVDLKTEYFDLGLENREATKDQVTIDAAEKTKELGVAVKCATITPNAQRMTEYNLTQMWKSPNGTIRAMLDGTVFRAPILIDGIKPFVSCWKKPITIARHAYGDVYKNTEIRVEGAARAELVVTYPDGRKESRTVFEYTDPGVLQGMYNTDKSIGAFARACFNYALSIKQDLWFATKDTISKTYDHRFKDVFAEIYENEYKAKFEAAGITYFYTLIDDAVARVMRSEGGFVWACKNYDGDVMSDMLASASGSLAMMTSVLVSPDGIYEYEAAHGTVTRHYYRYLKGEKTSTNPMATLFAWSGALRKRGELDGLGDLVDSAAADVTFNSPLIPTTDPDTFTSGIDFRMDAEPVIAAGENSGTITIKTYIDNAINGDYDITVTLTEMNVGGNECSAFDPASISFIVKDSDYKRGDFDGNNIVDYDDVIAFLSKMGATVADADWAENKMYDLDNDGDVDYDDLIELLSLMEFDGRRGGASTRGDKVIRLWLESDKQIVAPGDIINVKLMAENMTGQGLSAFKCNVNFNAADLAYNGEFDPEEESAV